MDAVHHLLANIVQTESVTGATRPDRAGEGVGVRLWLRPLGSGWGQDGNVGRPLPYQSVSRDLVTIATICCRLAKTTLTRWDDRLSLWIGRR
jgi:hypothetical protein